MLGQCFPHLCCISPMKTRRQSDVATSLLHDQSASASCVVASLRGLSLPTGESEAAASSPIAIVVSPASPEKPPRSRQGFVLRFIRSPVAAQHGVTPGTWLGYPLDLHLPYAPPPPPPSHWPSPQNPNWQFHTNCVQNAHWTWWIAGLVILGFFLLTGTVEHSEEHVATFAWRRTAKHLTSVSSGWRDTAYVSLRRSFRGA